MKYAATFFAIAVGGLICLIEPATAQSSSGSVDLIVRPAKQATGLKSALSGTVSKSTTADSLFEGVQSISSIGRGNQSKIGGQQPAFGAYRIRVSDSTAFRRLLGRWRNRNDVAYAHPNYTFSLNRSSASPSAASSPPLTGNPFAEQLDHLEVIRAIDAWSNTEGRRTVKIGVVDTGFYLNHPDLADQFWVNDAEDVSGTGMPEGGNLNDVDDDGNGYTDDVIGYDFVDRASPLQEGEFENRDPDPAADPKGDGSGHGTSVAAIATAAPGMEKDGIAGVAPNTRLVALRAFGGDGSGESDDIAAAIAYAAETDVDVLNLSFGQSQSVPLIRDAINYAHEQGTVVVASAGNEFTDDPHYPSDYPNVLSVVWLAEDGDGLPDFNRSQFGIGVDIGAPGSNVFTANFPASTLEQGGTPTDDELYHNPSGSSFSAPQVAGAAALLLSADSSLSPASIRGILTATAEDLTAENWDHQTGAGLLNVNGALMRSYPARTEIDRPNHNQGVGSAAVVPVIGTAIDPSFSQFSVSFAEGTKNLDDRADPWTEIAGPTDTQVRQDTLARWRIGDLSEGGYTLRLVTTLRDGRTIEDRRRVIVDRSAPEVSVEFLGPGRVRTHNGLVGDVATDDRTRLRATVERGGDTAVFRSQKLARRHPVTWPDGSGRGGTVDVTIAAINTSGLTTSVDTTLQIPAAQENTALLRRTSTSVPRGTLLPHAPDFDDDGLRELLLNQSAEGGRSDSLRSFEWMGEGFAPADTLFVPLAPRDVGDTDGDGREELLLQGRGGTLLLEQSGASAFPTTLAFADTVGASTSLDAVLNGIRLTELDGDGRGELLGTRGGTLELLERATEDADARFQTVQELDNPTSTNGRDSPLGNVIDAPNAGTGDFNADGNSDLVAGDRDGDLIVYEATADDVLEPVWTHETSRVDAGNRFATGNFTGGAGTSFATATTSSPRELDNGAFAAPITHYSVWTSGGEDQYERAYRLPIAGPYLSQGAMTAADMDGDGRAEVIIAHAPSLLVLDWHPGGGWRVRYQNQEGTPLQTRRLVAADFNQSGRPSILAESAGGTLVRFVVDEQALSVSPPQWTRAQPAGAASSKLVWTAAGADSITVYGGPPEGALDSLDVVVADSSYNASGPTRRRYALRAWENGTRSPLSASRTVRPHAPATVSAIEYPSPTTARLTFTEPLRDGLAPSMFTFGPDAVAPTRVVATQEQAAVVLRFPEAVAGQAAQLQWPRIQDRDGLPVGQTDTTLTFPASDRRTLFIKQATILDESRIRLRFNEPLDDDAARETDRYDLAPRGRVASIQQPKDASTVVLEVENLVLGPNGQESSLTVESMRSADGSRLAKEGGTVRLTKPADDLSNVFAYPNPYRAQSHSGGLTIAGLPRTATIQILTPDGRLVQELTVEGNRNGGTTWNLRNERGASVPSGIYLIRINAPDQQPVLEKAAVIK